MNRIGLVLVAVVIGVSVVLEIVYRHHGHPVFWWQATPVFDFVYGTAGCLALVLGAKWLGHAWLQRDRLYSDEDESGMSALHPAFVLFVTAGVAMAARGVLRQVVLLAGTLATLWAVWELDTAATLAWTLPNYTLQVVRVDALSHVFGLIFSLIACIGVLYALHVRRGGEHAATLVYAGGGLGVVFAGDWITLFVFWEMMAVASLFVVWFGGTAQSQAAGYRYLLVHIFGGSLLFCGILIHFLHGGEAGLAALTQSETPDAAFWLILLGVVINAAVPPLHAWLTDAYPEASVTGSVFLSAFTTKTAVYVLIRLFPGAEVLLWAGVIMTLYGVVYAILENDIRRLLAYHIVSQVGYMVAAVGMGTALALNGSGAHAFCHILYKALLFMGAGAVIQATGKRKLSDLGRPERRHAACLRPVYGGGFVDFRGAAVQRFHKQIDDCFGRCLCPPAAAGAAADAGRRGHLSERRAEAAVFHLYGRRPRPDGAAPAGQHAAGNGCRCLLLRLAGPLPAGALRATAV